MTMGKLRQGGGGRGPQSTEDNTHRHDRKLLTQFVTGFMGQLLCQTSRTEEGDASLDFETSLCECACIHLCVCTREHVCASGCVHMRDSEIMCACVCMHVHKSACKLKCVHCVCVCLGKRNVTVTHDDHLLNTQTPPVGCRLSQKLSPVVLVYPHTPQGRSCHAHLRDRKPEARPLAQNPPTGTHPSDFLLLCSPSSSDILKGRGKPQPAQKGPF